MAPAADSFPAGGVSRLLGVWGCRVRHPYPSFRRQLAGLAVVFAIAVPASAKDTKPATPASAGVAPLVHIDNFGRINDHYYRGAQPTDRDVADLAKLGVKTMIDLTNGDGDSNEQRLAESAGMKFVKIAMNTRVVPTPEQIATFLKIVNDPANQPVYVHCVGGRHRTGVMTAIYRIVNNKWTSDQAYKEMKDYDFGPSMFHPEFKDFVYDYHDALSAATPAVAVTGTR